MKVSSVKAFLTIASYVLTWDGYANAGWDIHLQTLEQLKRSQKAHVVFKEPANFHFTGQVQNGEEQEVTQLVN